MHRIHVVLDLDETLISSIDETEQHLLKSNIFSKLDWLKMDDYIVFGRPRLQEFLTWLFKHFDVSVWTAATKDYAMYVIQKFILVDRKRKLKYILYSDHCDKMLSKYATPKKLSAIPYFQYNTIIIDDNIDVYKTQPNTCIRVKAFDVLHRDWENDKELDHIKQKLTLMFKK